MHRLPDWRTRLHRYLAACRTRQFDWGTWDCATFVAGAVEAMTGSVPAVDVPGRYTTASGAVRVLRKAGFADLSEAVASEFETIARPREGDIAVMDGIEGQGLGIVGRGHVHCVSPGIGLWASSERPVKAFAVPFPEPQA